MTLADAAALNGTGTRNFSISVNYGYLAVYNSKITLQYNRNGTWVDIKTITWGGYFEFGTIATPFTTFNCPEGYTPLNPAIQIWNNSTTSPINTSPANRLYEFIYDYHSTSHPYWVLTGQKSGSIFYAYERRYYAGTLDYIKDVTTYTPSSYYTYQVICVGTPYQ